MRTCLMSLALLTLAGAAPALAQTLAPGAPIVDTKGQPDGTVVAVADGTATVRTDRHETRIPLTSIRIEETGGVVGMTQAELNAGVDRVIAQLAAAIAPGSTVYDPAGGLAGTIGAVEGDLVLLRLPSAREVRLPRNAFSMGRRGLLVGMTAAQIEAQIPKSG